MSVSITLLGTSGVGKTTLSDKLIADGWLHYSGDYRIATHYLGEHLTAWLKSLLKQQPLLAALLAEDAVQIAPKISVDNLRALSAFIGKLGREGYDLHTFACRQKLFAAAEKRAMYDFADFRKQHANSGKFINDAGGSLGEYIDDAQLMAFIQNETLPVYICADAHLQQELELRAMRYPKPLCYDPHFLRNMIDGFSQASGIASADDFPCDDFIRYVLPHMLAHRHERFHHIVRNTGIILRADDVWAVRDGKDFEELLAQAGWVKNSGR